MDILLVVIGALTLVILLWVLAQLMAIKKELAAKDGGPSDGGDKPPLPTSQSDTDNGPNDPNPDPPLPT